MEDAIHRTRRMSIRMTLIPSSLPPDPGPPTTAIQNSTLLTVTPQRSLWYVFHIFHRCVLECLTRDFQIEDCLYKIHRYFLTRESSFFRDMFFLPATSDEGKSDANPIVLFQTTILEFDSLLEHFYFRCVPAMML
jgi:hypothetical protein